MFMKLQLLKVTGTLPTSVFAIEVDGTVVGQILLRHRPSKSDEMPEGFENHIYYEINPEYRGRGYAKEALSLVLEEADKLGLKEVILNIEADNFASLKVAEANMARLIEQKKAKNGKTYKKYVIEIKKGLS